MGDNDRIRWLLSVLEDPFELLAFQSVGMALARSATQSEEALLAKMDPSGVSRKYWTVEEEHHQDEVALLVGASFVLGQLALTQSVAVIQRIGRCAGLAGSIPKKRAAILAWHSDIHGHTGLSELLIIDACANYFKHQHEWPSDWDATDGSLFQQRTIEIARRMGLSPRDVSDNLYTSLRSLDIGLDSIGSMGDRIQGWRERVATSLRELLQD